MSARSTDLGENIGRIEGDSIAEAVLGIVRNLVGTDAPNVLPNCRPGCPCWYYRNKR